MKAVIILVLVILAIMITGAIVSYRNLGQQQLLKTSFGLIGFVLGMLGLFYEINSDAISQYPNKMLLPLTAIFYPDPPVVEVEELIEEGRDKGQGGTELDSALYIFAIDISGSVKKNEANVTFTLRPEWLSKARDDLKSYGFTQSKYKILGEGYPTLFQLHAIKAAWLLTKLHKDRRENAQFEVILFNEYHKDVDKGQKRECSYENIKVAVEKILELIDNDLKEPSEQVVTGYKESNFTSLFDRILKHSINGLNESVTIIIFSDLIHDEEKSLDKEVDVQNISELSEMRVKYKRKLFNARNKKLKEKVSELASKNVLANLVLLTEENSQPKSEFTISVDDFLEESFPSNLLYRTHIFAEDDLLLYQSIDAGKPVFFNYTNPYRETSSISLVSSRKGMYKIGLSPVDKSVRFPKNSILCTVIDMGGEVNKEAVLSANDHYFDLGNLNKGDVIKLTYTGFPLFEPNLPKLRLIYTNETPNPTAQSSKTEASKIDEFKKIEKFIYDFQLAFYEKLSPISAAAMFLLGCLGLGTFIFFIPIVFFFKKRNIVKFDSVFVNRLLLRDSLDKEVKAFYNINYGKTLVVPKREAIAFYPFIIRLSDFFGLLAKTNHVKYTVKYELVKDGQQERDLILELDVIMFTKIIENLLYNALEHTPEKGAIGVSVRYPEDSMNRIYIEVKDSGPRIKQEKLEKVFQPYESGRSENGSIGLYLAQEYAKLLKGEITVKNNDGSKGCTFTFKFDKETPKVVSKNILGGELR